MTTVITRLFEDRSAAEYAVDKLAFRRLPSWAMDIITAPDGAKPATVKATMLSAKVHESAVDTYAKHLSKGQALLVVRATYKPLTAATITREVLARRDTIDTGDLVNDYYISDGPDPAPSIIRGHPHMLTLPVDQAKFAGQPISMSFGLRMLSTRRKRDSAISGGGYKSRMFWPMPLLSTKTRSNSAISGGKFMSRMFWPMPLLSRGQRANSVTRGLTISRIMNWPTISQRA